jgi:hypothetical protein
MKVKIVTLLAVALLMLAWFIPVYADGVPPLPHAFYGTLTINGSPAPIYTIVEARGTGVTTGTGNPLTTTEVGKYGSATSPWLDLIVQGFITEGATLTFYVNGVAAAETAAWHSGETTQLNLTVGKTATPPAVSSSAATAIGYTTATLNGGLTSLGTATTVNVSFEYGTSTNYGSTTTDQPKTTTGTFSADISGLAPSTVYHYRAKAVRDGTSYGMDMTFTTGTPAPGGGGGGAPDTTPPTISDISVSNITKTSGDTSWKTDEMSDTQLEYWASPSKLSPLNTAMVINHLIRLTDLTPGTTYYFKVMSKDAAGNLAVSSEYTFTTLPGAAAFATSKLSISPSEVYIGETVAITVLVTNTGDGAGSYKVTLKINGVVEATEDITLNAGASGEVTFTTAKNVAGSYSVGVDGLSGSFTVKEKASPPPPPPPPVKPPIKWPLIGGIIGAVVVVGLIIVFVARRRAA